VKAVLAGLALLLTASVVAGLWRVHLGPTAADRMLAPQLFGTAGVAILLVGADWLAEPSLRDVALVLALLALLTTTAFALRFLDRGGGER